MLTFNDGKNSDGLMVADTADLKSLKIANEIGDELDRHYPGYPWYIKFMPEQGVGFVKVMSLSNTYGVTFHDVHVEEKGLKTIVRLVGEQLERYKVSRSGMIEDEILNLKRDGTGHAIFDYRDSVNYKIPQALKDAYDKLG